MALRLNSVIAVSEKDTLVQAKSITPVEVPWKCRLAFEASWCTCNIQCWASTAVVVCPNSQIMLILHRSGVFLCDGLVKMSIICPG